MFFFPSLAQDTDAAQKCLNESRNYTLQLDGRTLDAVLAVTRENLEKQKQEQQKEHKDKRNLYLGREGCKENEIKMFSFSYNNFRYLFSYPTWNSGCHWSKPIRYGQEAAKRFVEEANVA